MKFDELYKKVIDAQKAFEKRHIPISLDFKIEDLRDALVESNDTIEKLKQNLEEKDSFIKTLGEGQADLAREIERLKQKLEDAKATAYAESVDAGMRERRLKRALYKACAMWADRTRLICSVFGSDAPMIRWKRMLGRCRAMAEKFGG